MSEDHPHASSYLDRHGKRRWRFRRGGKTIQLPKTPGEPEFETAYAAALEGRPIEKSNVRRLPTSANPKSLRAAWRILTTNDIRWKQLEPISRQEQTYVAERFLRSPVVKGEPTTFGDVAVINFQRKHIKAILAERSDTPHAASHLLRIIRKLVGVALDQEWIENDPTYRLSFRPAYRGWKAWTNDACTAFEAKWETGTKARLAYALALYFGHRRTDVAKVRWSDLEQSAGNVIQQKTGKTLWIPMLPELAKVLEGTARDGEFVLVSQFGRPFSPKGLSMAMQAWTADAGLGAGHTLHGLRKTLGKRLAESGATTRQIMAILGHDNIAHAELYTREAEQRQLARDGMRKLTGEPRG